MAEEKKSTELALDLKNLNQDSIPIMLKAVTAQIKKIKGGFPDKTETTDTLQGFGKIKEIKTVESLIKAYSMVSNKEKAYNAAAEAILPEGIKKPAFKLNGSSGKAWTSDIEARIAIVGNQEKLDKLTKIKDKLESNLSAEEKLKKDLLDISKILLD